MWLAPILRPAVRTGNLSFVDPTGRTYTFGDGTGPPVCAHVHNRRTDRRLALNPYLALGEAYMDGTLTMERGDIGDLIALVGRNLGIHRDLPIQKALRVVRRLTRPLQQFNPARRARHNAAHHYDLSGALYELFLDADRQYSCAYFVNPGDSLERAQEQKKQHVAAKLLIEPDMHVLDIGCGWGGLALYLARTCKARVTGITLSEEQCRVARERAAAAGLDDRVAFRLEDYRATRGRFDRIVSVGMFEHVGVGHYDRYFRAIRRLLDERGVALVHTIARSDGPGVTNGFIRKYIFPGGYSPALSEVLPVVERNGLWLTDLEVLRLHYARTLSHWRRRFAAARHHAAQLYDERFCRMWEVYLAGSEAAFRDGGHMVAQLQVTREQDGVPLTRDYIDAFKRAHPVMTN